MDNIDNIDNNKIRDKKLLLLVFLVFFTAAILTVCSYAWFIGTDVVSVNPIVINVSSIKGIELSLDGEHWEKTTLTLTHDTVLGLDGTNKGYSGNKNAWTTTGLVPISSKGEIDTTHGRLKLFSELSLTATPGGYRLISTQIDNSTNEQDGYLAFDLFIRNGVNPDYVEEYNPGIDEAIYLTRDSSIVVTSDGNVTEDYGLANSLRVAFMQVGRVKSDTTPITAITGITCTTSSPVTGLCSDVDPIIWEPNNTSHNSNLIDYYSSICLNRTGVSAYQADGDYSCMDVVDGEDVNTYVVKNAIAASTKTDIFDGLNYYSNSNLENIETFTDSQKMVSGTYRNPFMYLSPNSITKVRVYLYLEGQDVDNYASISTGKTITVNFGFTKDMLSEEEGTSPYKLQDYSWTQLKRISDKLANGSTTYEEIQTQYGINIGDTKKAIINDEEHVFRLVDVLHDVDDSGNALGMTFEQVDLMDSSYSMKNSMTNSDGWNNSNLKTTINSWTIESELDDVITAAKKPFATSVSSGTIAYDTSKLWIMSETEMANSHTSAYSGAIEGTPYKYYTDLSYLTSSRIKNSNGHYISYWLRTPHSWESSKSNFSLILNDGSINYSSEGSSSSMGVAVCFCI